MRHVEEAAKAMADSGNSNSRFISLKNCKDKKGIVPIVSFDIQSDPIGEVGVNGCQARDIIEYSLHLIQSLNDRFPCQENKDTIRCLKDALEFQDERTKDREQRKVEGKNEA